jgi:hypothetical protein
LRAYIQSHEVVLRNWNTIPEAIIAIKNSGPTPANDVTVWSGIRVATLPPNEEVFKKPEGIHQAKGPLAPGGIMKLTVTHREVLNQTWVDALKSGHAAIFVCGEIRYEDVFGKITRTTIFRYARGGPYGAPENGQMPHTENGNKID